MVTIIGGGFAGVEAAWACANRGQKVRLFEMRPTQTTGAHKTDFLAELVCSNSFKSKNPDSPAGLLKAEMALLGSLILEVANEHTVPAGEALAVDRVAFSSAVTQRIESHPHIELIRGHAGKEDVIDSLPLGPVIIATGPLTSPDLAEWLAEITGRDGLYFYDAVSPTVDASSLNRDITFAASRYDKGEGQGEDADYLNCPFDKGQYFAFVRALVSAEQARPHGMEDIDDEESLEKIKYFAGCMPIEAIAEGGELSLAFGNFKPVGLTDPRTGRRPFAALQLRPENRDKSLYTLVACQNRMKWGEQKRVFQMVPGLENAEFVRFGVIHRNTYLDAPRALEPDLQLKSLPGVYIAGQLTGVEGYVESAAMGIYAGIAASMQAEGNQIWTPPRASAYGSLISHLQDSTPREFAPMNINWGLFSQPEEIIKDKGKKKEWQLNAARQAFAVWIEHLKTPTTVS